MINEIGLWKFLKDIITECESPKKMTDNDLKPIIEKWKLDLNRLPAHEKKLQINNALNSLLNEPTLTIEQMSVALCLIEKVVLSRRVSRLGKKQFYKRVIKLNYNHVLSLEGIESYITSKYPNLPIFFTCHCWEFFVNHLSSSTEMEEPSSTNNDYKKIVNQVSFQLKTGNPVWIVVQKPSSFHLTLTMFRLVNEKINIYIWDSLGISIQSVDIQEQGQSSKNEYLRNMKSLIHSVVQDNPIKNLFEVSDRRQMDSTNCASFVLQDLKVALKLLKSNANLFSLENDHIQAHPAFFSVSQVEKNRLNTPEKYLKRISIHKGEIKGNAYALVRSIKFLRFYINSMDLFAAPQYHEEGDSESDKEEECCVM
jgi:hypothetical protein